ncbi:MAG: hypothetical protein Q8Q12_01955 [bacterium]|nr:hypothetical protein [bacterium]
MAERPEIDIEVYRQAAQMSLIGSQAVRKAQEERGVATFEWCVP